MELLTWSPKSTHPGAARIRDELFVTFDHSRATRILIVPALFDEANKLRRFTITLMRALDDAGIDSALPDLPGCNESLTPLCKQTLTGWRSHVDHLAERFRATHTFTLRAGAMLAPEGLPGWAYAPVDGAKLLSGLLRAQTIAAREAGLSQSRDDLLTRGATEGVSLAGWSLGAEMVKELSASKGGSNALEAIDHEQIPGSRLWLRAEPGEDAKQVAALAHILVDAIDPSQERIV